MKAGYQCWRRKWDKMALTDKQQRFVELWTGNATETATLAGYADARNAGLRCLKNADICRQIKEKRAKELKPLILDRQGRQKLWTDIALSADEATKDRLKASELLGKSEGDFLDRVQNDVTLHAPEIKVIFADD